MLIALRAPLRCPFQKQRATKRRRSAAHYSLQTHKWRKTTRKPERKYCHGKLGESCLDWICCRSSRTGRWHCLISWLETQIQRVLPQIVSTHTFNQETNANNGRKEKPGEAQPNKLANLVWSTNGPRTDLYSHAVKSKWKSKTKQNVDSVSVCHSTQLHHEGRRCESASRGMRHFEIGNVACQMSKEADKLRKCAVWNDRLVDPNEMFKGNYRHNWGTLFILTFCNNYSRPEIKFYE